MTRGMRLLFPWTVVLAVFLGLGVFLGCGEEDVLGGGFVPLPSDCETPSPDGRLSSAGDWSAAELLPGPDDQLQELLVFARVDSADANAVFGTSATSASAFSDLLTSIRFSASGLIDVRDADAYDRDVDVEYEANRWYGFRVRLDHRGGSYDVAIVDCDGGSTWLKRDAVFRQGALVGRQTTLATWTGGARLDVSSPNWTTTQDDPAVVDTPDPDEPGEPPDVPDSFPNASNTGIAGVGLTEADLTPSPTNGRWRITEPGVYSDFVHNGVIEVDVDGVTLRRCLVRNAGGILIFNDEGNDLTVEDCTIIGTGRTFGEDICAATIGRKGYTARRVDVSGCADAFKTNGRVVVEDSYVHDLVKACGADDCTHNDTFQSGGRVESLIVRGNSLLAPVCRGGNRHFQLTRGDIDELIVEANYFEGLHGIFNIGDVRVGSARFRNNLLGGSVTEGPFNPKPGLYTGAGAVERQGNVFVSGDSADDDPRDRNVYQCTAVSN